MGTVDKSKKRIQVWKKAAIHFSLCFVMGFFVGFAPTNSTSLFSIPSNPKNLGILIKNNPVLNRSLMSDSPRNLTATSTIEDVDVKLHPRPYVHLIIITTIRPNDRFKVPFLMRLANTLKSVSPPLLWIVVEAYNDASGDSNDILRKSGIMYRRLTYKENFTDSNAEYDHQRNVALNHIEYHRLNGIVHFADVSNVYELEFFEEIREISTFGVFPVVMMSANRRRVMIEGPVCRTSKIVGWQLKILNNGTMDEKIDPKIPTYDNRTNNGGKETKPLKINISSFAFNSSILWDPERWGRASSVLDTSQDSIKFVQEVILEDETKLKAIPSNCAKIMLWHFHIPRSLPSQNTPHT